MSTILRPVGERSPQVYWMRRLFVLGAAFGVVVAVWLLFTRGGDATVAAEGGTDAAQGAVAAAEAASAGGRTCTAADLTIALTSDAPTYPAGSTPAFFVTITNTSPTSCTVDAGDASREVLITSGADRVWSSRDCAGDAPERLLLLPAGGADGPELVTWERVRSAEGCTQVLPKPKVGTYRVIATLSGVQSAPLVFELG